ncbi:uncharacterized protein LOC133298465, partial [Gastrolobium bilobum]|uniref:uncharacterized protein LOC133298465 n=1 Tax=Gastrolobium bilobum TaxID=150636 RepID=UPI002AB30924
MSFSVRKGSISFKNSKGSSAGSKKGELENLPPNAALRGVDLGRKQRTGGKAIGPGGNVSLEEGSQAKAKDPSSLALFIFISSWNCRGVGKKEFPALIKDMKYRFNLSVSALLETRISGSRGDRIVNKLGFPKNFRKEAVGFAGGIWLLWDDKKSKVDIIAEYSQCIHTRVFHVEEEKSELITFVYGSPRRVERQALWLELDVVSQEVDEPC